MLTIDQIHTTGTLVLATAADVHALEAELWITFPAGYREYVTKLGEGVLGGELVRIYPPWRIAKELGEWRRRIAKHWFWDKSRDVLPKDRALECVIVGDTTGGDELVFHPARPGHLFVLPRQRATVFDVEGDLWAAIEFMCASGKLVKAFAARDFVPFDSRKDAAKKRETASVPDPEGESKDALVAAAKAWAKRHDLRKAALEDLRELLNDEDVTVTGLSPAQSKDRKPTLLYEALVFEGRPLVAEAGYLVLYRIDDAKTKLEIGTFRWNATDSGTASQYAQNMANVAKLAKGGRSAKR